MPISDLELAVILEGIRMIETLVAMAEDQTRKPPINCILTFTTCDTVYINNIIKRYVILFPQVLV